MVQTAIWDALRRAYELACENFKFGNSNATTFGTDVYNFAVAHLARESKHIPGLDLVRTTPTFRMQSNGILLACHKVGSTGNLDIWSSFPNNSGAAARLIEQQRIPNFPSELLQAKDDEGAVIAHFGNHITGFIGAYLCVPSDQSRKSGRITEWCYAAPITPMRTNVAKFPPEERIEDVQIQRKYKDALVKETDDGAV